MAGVRHGVQDNDQGTVDLFPHSVGGTKQGLLRELLQTHPKDEPEFSGQAGWATLLLNWLLHEGTLHEDTLHAPPEPEPSPAPPSPPPEPEDSRPTPRQLKRRRENAKKIAKREQEERARQPGSLR